MFVFFHKVYSQHKFLFVDLTMAFKYYNLIGIIFNLLLKRIVALTNLVKRRLEKAVSQFNKVFLINKSIYKNIKL